MKNLAINEMFTSISGEVGVIPQGELTTVIRLQGCNLRCDYCDAKDSQECFRENIKILTVLEFIRKKEFPVLITGGEPLGQKNSVIELVRSLPIDLPVQIETNGTVSISDIPDHVCIVMDYKLDNPPEPKNLQALKSSDYLKFVVTDLGDLRLVMALMDRKLFGCKATIAISATDVTLYPEIIETIKQSKHRILVNVQLHKFIGVQ